MADVELRPLRRKKGANFYPKESPFPIPIQTITKKESCDERWYFYKGHFRDNCVVIEDLGDVTFLYRMGFFGKGSLSKSKPEHEAMSDISQKAFSRTEKIRRLPPKERQIRQSKFREIRKERFRNHRGWSNAAEHTRRKAEQSNDKSAPTDDLSSRLSETPSSEKHNEYMLSAKRRKTDELQHNEEDPMPHETTTKDDNTNWGQESEAGAGDRDRSCEELDSTNSSESYDDTTEKDEGTVNMTGDVNLDREKKRQKNQARVDPYKVYEQLQLSLEEAFFLSYGLGCLSVLKEGKVLPLREMWWQFCKTQPSFIPNYVVYHYFRSKGWVPKLGIKYGSDFVLYREGMPFYHSSYSVVVQLVDSESFDVPIRTGEPLECRQVTWAELSGLSRVNEHAAKRSEILSFSPRSLDAVFILFRFHFAPEWSVHTMPELFSDDMSEEELLSPDCIVRFKVQEVVMRRWVPEKAREPDKKT